MVDGEMVDEAIWGGFVLRRGSTVKFVADFGFLAALLMWAFPTIFTAAAMSSAALGPITWAAVFNTIGWIGASYLINSLMPGPQLPKGGSSSGSMATSWDPKTTQQEGLAVPRSYGTFRAHGNIVSCYTAPSADGRKQLIFALVAFADGPIASVSEIIVNGRDADNLPDLTTEVRLGNVTQTHVSFFDKTRLQYRYNIEITNADGPETIQIPDDDYDDLELLFRYDVWHRYKDGDAGTAAANIKVEISVRDSGSWTEVFTASLQDSSTEIKWPEFLVSDYYALTRGVLYDLRITKTNADDNHDRRRNDVWLEAIKEVVDVPFTYPGMVLVGLSGISSEDLPGFMDVSALLGPRIVDTYNGLAWTLADDSSDPAWTLWDDFTLPLITGDGGATPYAIDHYRGMAIDRMDVADFYALSLFCNEFVPDADGADEPRITFNGIIDFESNMWDVAKLIAEVARCLPIWNGNQIKLAINKRKTRSGIISVGNILNGSFEETFAPKIDAASEIDAQFNDRARDYTRRTIPFFNPNSTNTGNKISINLPGLVKLTEVVRHIKGRLKQTELRRRTLVSECGMDAIGYEVGDMIGV
ncbi:MAG: phage tail protein, partial [Actinomycetota bacterium]|nr:phage tail protein [Actinomycetota bacterium]